MAEENILNTELTPEDPAFEVSQARSDLLDQQKEEFRQSFDVRGARRAGYGDADLIQYGIDNFPGGYDYQAAREAGYTDDEIMMDMFNVRANVTKPEAYLEGVVRGTVRSAPVAASGFAGMLAGTPGGPAGMFSGAIIGGTAGIPAGSQLDQYLFDQTPLKPSLQVPFEGGITTGGGIPFTLSPSAAALRFSSGALTYQNNITALMGRMTPAEKLVQTLQQNPLRSAYLEGTALLSSSQGAMLAESLRPGDPLSRAAGEIVFGAANPTGIMSFILEGLGTKGVNLFRKFFSETGRKSQQGQFLYKFFEDPNTPGGGPGTVEAILRSLQTFEDAKDGTQPLTGLQKLAEAYGLDVKEYAPTPATITKNPALINLTKNLAAQSSDLGPTIKRAMEKDFETIAQFVTLLKNTGDPTLVAAASNAEQYLMRGIITSRLDKANIAATRANKQLLPKTETGEPDTQAGQRASLNIAGVTDQAIKDVRAREKELYELIDKKDDMTVASFLKAYEKMEQELLDYQVEIPLPIKALLAKARGESLEAADELSTSISNLQNRINKSEDKINDVGAMDQDSVDFVNTIIKEGNYDSFAFDVQKGRFRVDDEQMDLTELEELRAYVYNEQGNPKLGEDFLKKIEDVGQYSGDPEGTFYEYKNLFDEVFQTSYTTPTNQQGEVLRPIDFQDLDYFKKLDIEDMATANGRFLSFEVKLKDVYKAMRKEEGDRGLINENIKNLQTVFKAHKKVIQDIFEFKKNKNNEKYFKPKEVRVGTLISKRDMSAEEFEALSPTEKLRQQLKEVQSYIKDFETTDKELNVGFADLNYAAPKVARIRTILKEKAKVLNNSIQLAELKTAKPVDTSAEAGIITVGDAMNGRSVLLNAARKHIANGEFQEAHFLSDLADAIKKDFGIKSGGEDDLTAGSTAALTNNQLALRQAFNFSKSMNDVFTRAFPNVILARKRSGGTQVMPELLSEQVFRGGGDALSVRYDQLDNAITFLAKEEGIDFDDTLTSKLGTLQAAQEDLLRVAADKLIDTTTGRITIESLNKFKNDYRNVLSRFPDLVNDLETVDKAENALSLMLTKTGDPRLKSNRARLKGKGVGVKGTYQEKLDNKKTFYDFAKKDANINKLVGNVLGSPGNRPTDGSQGLIHLIKRVNRADAGKFPGAKNGLRDVIMERALEYATGKTDQRGQQTFNFFKLKEFLTEPMNVKDLSPLEIMRKNGLIDEGYAVRLNTLINEGITVQKNFKGVGDFEKVKIPEPLSGRAYRTMVRLGFLRLGRLATRRFPGEGQGLAEPTIAAQEGLSILVDVPDMASKHLLFQAAQDPKFFKEIMEMADTSIKKIERSRRLNTYLYNAGFISAKSYRENKEEAEQRARESYVPVDAPALIQTEENRPVKSLRPEPIELGQAIPAQRSALPTTNIASVSPSLNPVPTASGPVNRQRFAALFPEDRGLIEASGKQGIGSLFG